MNTIKHVLKSDPTIKKFSDQLLELSEKYQVYEHDKKSEKYNRKWTCKEAQAKYIFLKTELKEYIRINFPEAKTCEFS
jgi:phosphopantetheinyl transferase (holo-ACP synthase)